MLLQPGQSLEFMLSNQVCSPAGFNIDVTDTKSVVATLIKAIDGVRSVTVKTTPAPDWTSKAPQWVLNSTIQGSASEPASCTNALWCMSTDSGYVYTARVSFDVSSPLNTVLSKAIGWITAGFDGLVPKTSVDLPPITLTLTKTARFVLTDAGAVDDTQTIRDTSLSLQFNVLGFHLHLDLLAPDGYRLLLLPPRASSTGKASDSGIGTMIENAFGKGQNYDPNVVPNSGDGTDPFTRFFNRFHLWYIRVDHDDSQAEEGKQLQWGIAIIAIWQPKDTIAIAVSLTYDSKSSTFAGRLLRAVDIPDPLALRIPSWDPRLDPSFILCNSLRLSTDPSALTLDQVRTRLGGGLNLFELMGLSGGNQPPVPNTLSAAEVVFSRPAGSNFRFQMSADVTRVGTVPRPESGGAPDGGFSWDEAALDMSISSEGEDKKMSYSVDLFMTCSLTPDAANKDILPAYFGLGMHYDKTAGDDKGTWILRGTAQNLSVGLLASFFDNDATRDGAMAVMSKLSLRSLDVIYTYEGQTASSFLITAALVLGGLELDLSYQYVSSLVKPTGKTATQQFLDDGGEKAKLPSDKANQLTDITGTTSWKFMASLSATSPESTIASIAESLRPGAGGALPEWVGGIVVNSPTSSSSSSGGNPPLVELEFGSETITAESGQKSDVSLLTVWLNILGFNLTFVQFKSVAHASGGGGSNGDSEGSNVVKRILRISVDQIPLMKDIPLVGQLPQPFDHLEYLWVEDESTEVDGNLKGITRSDLDLIKKLFPLNIPFIQVKESTSAPPPGSITPDIVLQAGHHFIVVVSGKVILDHVFQANKANTQPDSEDLPNKAVVLAGEHIVSSTSSSADTKPPEPAPTKGLTETRAGLLSISALTFQFKNPALVVTVDATLRLGPVTFSVIGFTLAIDLSRVKLSNLAAVVTDGLIQVGLHGIECGVAQGPLTLEGVFIHDLTAAAETYSGGIAVGFEAWQVLAIGQYTITKATATSDAYRALFVYGKLDGPLVELEFVTISGVRLGFGYNYAVRMPQLSELYSFPFISDSASAGVGNDPMKALNAMVFNPPYFVYPKENSSWFCAGMTLTAFDSLTLTAVMLFDIDTNPTGGGVAIAMLGDGIFQMEPLAPPDYSLFYIEIVVSVELNFIDGYIAANAVMAPSSHIYVPEARLSGGASFYSWFGKNTHAGDWVVSVGGYARGYSYPSHYPNPDRIALSFTLGDAIQVLGNGYLAVTPKCAMAGGLLHFSLSVGPVSAHCDVILDAFINFKPFHFRAEISLSVGVECDIDILFVHIHISASIGADLTVWGPNKFGGHAWVDFWFFGFSIDFGADENGDAKKAVTLLDFYAMVKAAGPSSDRPAHDTTAGDPDLAQHKLSVEFGLIAATTPPADSQNNFPSTGAATQWQVQAGTLQVRIDCPFSLSDAYILNQVGQPGAPEPNSNATMLVLPPKLDRTIPPTPAVYSWPMHSKASNPISSSLEIAVYQVSDLKNEVLIPNFRGELVLKSVGTALWAVYDETQDPLIHPRPSSLSNGTGATVDLVQAVRLFPPPAVLYPSKIVEFDATAAMCMTIAGDFELPPQEEQGSQFSGAYFEPDVPDDDFAAQSQRWQDLAAIWNPCFMAPSGNTKVTGDVSALRAGIVKAVADVLEWTIRPPEQLSHNNLTPPTPVPAPADPGLTPNTARINADGRTDWQLIDAQPTALPQQLDKYYAALPFAIMAAS
ncbi:hypothetical protein GQ53DRAFT_455304 [Thozetella sp. PMI_491]|nr:hypothetical protein GQ53DRAFT_455304 [Thozetella sp. PMI_491]